jgi:lysyl-tRNA synthetase class 2
LGNFRLTSKHNALKIRAKVIQTIRDFFISEGYLEVDTPLLIPAPAPESHIEAISAEGLFLHTSPEICMKRLLAAGYDRIFQICHCWRANERGDKHMPEFTMLEWYRTDSSYYDLMNDCEKLIKKVAEAINYKPLIEYQGATINIQDKWERLTVKEAFKKYTKLDIGESLANGSFDEVITELIEPNLGIKQPTFLYEYPAKRASLARLKEDDNSVAERFELYIAGIELANAYSELTDPEEQRLRFIQEAEFRKSNKMKTYPLPEPFLEELESMPASAGIALGIDRLVMLMANASKIDDVVSFTQEEL